MDRVNIREKCAEFLKKYRYVLLILGVGLFLMLLPEGGEAEDTVETTPAETTAEQSLQQSLEDLLSQVRGAGQVRVLLTESEGERTVYQTDQDSTSDSLRVETVIVTGADKAQHGLVQKTDPPVYLGAVVVCQGGDDPAVKLAIVEAVSSATGLGADKITVLKMK